MFRSISKKKKNNQPRRTTILDDENKNDDQGKKDEEEEDQKDGNDDQDKDPTVVVNRHKKQQQSTTSRKKKDKKKRSIASLSFAADDDDHGETNINHNDSSGDDKEGASRTRDSKSKRRRKKGLGFGGGGGGAIGSGDDWDLGEGDKKDDNVKSDIPKKMDTTTGSSAGSPEAIRPSYGKDMLEQLKAEQVKTNQTLSSSTKEAAKSKPSNPPEMEQHNNQKPTPPLPTTTTTSLPSFVPLSSKHNNDSHQQDTGVGDDHDKSPQGQRADMPAPVLLTGEEAIRFQEQHEDAYPIDSSTPLPPSGFPRADEDDEEEDPTTTAAWEEQIARRAGIATTSQHGNDGDDGHRPKTTATTTSSIHNNNLPSLETLYQQLESTFQNLKEHQQTSMEQVLLRRQADLAQTKSTVQQQTLQLETAGTACHDYQRLRHDLTMFVGALRDLQSKMIPIQQTLLKDMVQTRDLQLQQEWIHLQNDCTSILQQAQLLDTVVGRTPPSLSHQQQQQQQATVVDEFGRDVQSQFHRERDKRFLQRRRRQILQQQQQTEVTSNGNYDHEILSSLLDLESNSDNDNNDDDNDKMPRTIQERYDTLQEAIKVALDGLDDQYVSLKRLLSIFTQWKQSYPDEYRESYACLSLGDLASIIMITRLCQSKSFYPPLLHLTVLFGSHDKSNGAKSSEIPSPSEDENSDTKDEDSISWTSSLELLETTQNKSASSKQAQEEEEEETTMDRVYGKVLVPFLLSMLEDDNQNTVPFLLHARSRFLSRIIEKMAHDNNNNNNTSKMSRKTNETLAKAICQATRTTLDLISILFMASPQSKNDNNNNDDDGQGNNSGEQKNTGSGNGIKDPFALEYAKSYALSTQGRWIQQLLVCILSDWMPLLMELVTTASDMGFHNDLLRMAQKSILDFISNKFLFLLSSLQQQQQQNQQQAKELFSPVWNALQTSTGSRSHHHHPWWQAPSWMLESAPIRAAASAYGLTD